MNNVERRAGTMIVVGLAVALAACAVLTAAGCGSVNALTVDSGDSDAGADGTAGAAGTSGSGGRGGAGSSGAAGRGGTTGAAGTTGSGGAPAACPAGAEAVTYCGVVPNGYLAGRRCVADCRQIGTTTPASDCVTVNNDYCIPAGKTCAEICPCPLGGCP